MRRIALDLSQAGILDPKDGASWNPSTIAKILKNPAFPGRYSALRQEMKPPDTIKSLVATARGDALCMTE